ncbi:rRNA-processing protein UTP23 [Lindgomyces ingoldianus]|uniref:rRNA-processing protein UTP23 n=1 Tax=Lindgomyces ingoldianus TaxID=673940 RepID=A0ACB6QMV7_9PLEO|nr:rRNA-processing protein UTP23 [Lindgomyces ingoldianus]KAF2468241.1 rRNA-processing protein UTP23 [Lindgomyces ingoldianus]
MRVKRAKAYRKLIHQYQVTFNFREPYQVLLDSQILQDAARFKMDLVGLLERTLQGKVKPMITQCDMRHLYNAEPKDQALILKAKEYERRRCNHHELEDPLSTLECLSSVVDPKNSLTNKNRYVVASQDPKVRAHMRAIPGVPLIYINKSVVILEPMAASTHNHREQGEKAKFKAGLKGRRGVNPGQKRKRDEAEEDSTQEQHGSSIMERSTGDDGPQKKKRTRGPKGPNPLSVKKPKKRVHPPVEPHSNVPVKPKKAEPEARRQQGVEPETPIQEGEESAKRKRQRKHKPKSDSGASSQMKAEVESNTP